MQNLNNKTMKNLFKTGALALAIASVISSCGDHDKTTTKTPDSPKVQIDTTKKAAIDTTKKDTVKKP